MQSRERTETRPTNSASSWSRTNVSQISFCLKSLCFRLLVSCARSAEAADTVPPAAAWIPEDAAIVLEVPRPKVIIDKLFDDRIVTAVTSHPAYKDQMARKEMQDAINAVKLFETKYETDVQGLLNKLLGGGITIAVGPGENSLLIIESEDADILKEIHDFLMMVARSEARKEGAPDRVKSAEYRGVTGWRFAPNEAHAIVGNRLILTNNPEILKTVLDRARKRPCQTCPRRPRTKVPATRPLLMRRPRFTRTWTCCAPCPN